MKGWHVYIVACRDEKLYTGITSDLPRRVKEHASGRGCKFTRVRAPVTLVYSEPCGTRADALVREAAIKRYPRKRKLALISGIVLDNKVKGSIVKSGT